MRFLIECNKASGDDPRRGHYRLFWKMEDTWINKSADSDPKTGHHRQSWKVEWMLR